jgi:transcriptional regulator with XRE-family HTH domain
VTAAPGPGGDACRLREQLGRELARRRRDAGLTQEQLAALAGTSRTTVGHAEQGRADVGARLWRAADRVLAAGGYFTAGYERARGDQPAPRAASPAGTLACDLAMKSAGPGQAAAACRRNGWPAVPGPALAAGTILDALEVSRAAGLTAAAEWQATGGTESAARGLPGLPAPEAALAVIDAGERWYFLVRAGAYPWQRLPPPATAPPGTTPASDSAARPPAAIRWHSAGSRIPLPPARARWAHLPAALFQPPPPHAVLDLLDWACARARHPAILALRRGITVAPANTAP